MIQYTNLLLSVYSTVPSLLGRAHLPGTANSRLALCIPTLTTFLDCYKYL